MTRMKRIEQPRQSGVGSGDTSPGVWLIAGCKSAFIREIRVHVVSFLPTVYYGKDGNNGNYMNC